MKDATDLVANYSFTDQDSDILYAIAERKQGDVSTGSGGRVEQNLPVEPVNTVARLAAVSTKPSICQTTGVLLSQIAAGTKLISGCVVAVNHHPDLVVPSALRDGFG